MRFTRLPCFRLLGAIGLTTGASSARAVAEGADFGQGLQISWPTLFFLLALLIGFGIATVRFGRLNRLLKQLTQDNIQVVRALLTAQEELQDNEEKFRTVADFTADWEYWITPDQRLAYVAPAALGITGYTQDEFIADPGLLDAIIYPEDRPKYLEHIERYYGAGQSEESSEIEFRIRRKDGEVCWIGHRCRAVFSRDRYLGRRVSNRDITERKRAEDQLRLAAKVIEESGEGILITDADNHIVSVNRAFSQITGYAPAEVIGTAPQLLSSGRQGIEFYRCMWESINTQKYWQGEIWNRRKDGNIYPEWLSISAVHGEDGLLSNYVGIFSDMTERKAAQEKIEFLAHHDHLTGLPNRVLLKDRIEQAIALAARVGQQVALLYLDLDRFKSINDTLGHHYGDALLRAVVQRVKDCVRETDTISRHGGDEFLVVLAGIDSVDGAADAARRILARIAEPFTIDDHLLTTSISVGIAMYPDDGAEFDVLLKKADTAMYHAKNAGRNDYHFFSEAMNTGALEKMALEARLRTALENGEFLLYYQPQIDVRTGNLVGTEALIRWDSPDLGLVSPAKFIPVAEESGLIIPMGHWVLREACRQMAGWDGAGLPQLPVSVNLSALQFRRGDFVDTVSAALAEFKLAPERLELELTESILIDDAEGVLAKVRRLKEIGVRLAIDDFGTGFSSLAYLKRFAVDRLKIDQSFVRDIATDLNDAAIVRAIIQLGDSFGLTTIAEGVETAEQLEFLSRHGCDEVQGYFYAKPMSPDQFVGWAVSLGKG